MINVKEIKDKEKWEKFVKKYKGANFLQSWNWGQFHRIQGNRVFYLGFFESKKLKGTALIIKKRALRGDYLVCPAGPLIKWENLDFFKAFINKIKEIAKKENCCFARVRPQINADNNNKKLFRKYGFIWAPMHLHAEHTFELDLGKSEDEILANMRKNTRYEIRKAKRLGVKVEKSKDLKDIDILYDLQMETVKRAHFVPFSKQFFKDEFKTFVKDNQALIFKSIYKNKVLAAAIIIFYGREAAYHYAGSSSEMRKIPSTYALQWEAIKEAKKRGCERYNFWGVAPPDSPKHRFWGVTIFKRGFGGKRRAYLHAQDLPTSPFYFLNYFIESVRKKLRGL